MSIEAGVQFLYVKVPICKGFPILFNDNRLYGDSEMVTVEPFAFSPITLFNERSRGVQILVEGVHFRQRGVHLLIIPLQKKKPEQLRSDLDFCAVLENECDLTVLVNDGFFNHHRPDGIIPFVHHLWLLFEGADIKCHFAVGLTPRSA